MKEICAITGGTSGLGEGFVERFVKDGYEVVFCGRNEQAGAAIAERCGATYFKVDVTVPSEVEGFFEQIKTKFGALDVLINNAGVISNVGRQADIPVEEYLKIMDVNMNGAWYTLKYGVKLIEQGAKGGRVVNISSLAGLSGACYKAGASHYGASKHALCGLTKIMALEYAFFYGFIFYFSTELYDRKRFSTKRSDSPKRSLSAEPADLGTVVL